MAYLNSGSGPGGLLSDQPALSAQEPAKGSVNPNFGSNFSLGVGLTPAQSQNLGASPAPSTTPQQGGTQEAKTAFDNAAKRYDTAPVGPMDVVDLADVNTNRRFGLFGKRTDVQGLISRGFNYLDDNGQIVQVKPGEMSEEDFLALAGNAKNNQSLAQKYGIGNTNGWTRDAIEFRRRQYQGSNPYMTFDPTKPAQSTTPTTAEGTTGKKSYNWDISFDKEGDFSWDDISARLIKAMYANGKYDILDQMLDNGKITDNGLSAFYQTTLGLTPGEDGKIRFNKDALQAALNGQYITQAQFDEMAGLLPQKQVAAETQPAAPATTPAQTPAAATPTDWEQVARDNGFKDMEDVKRFQQASGLKVDGKVGPQTLAKLKANQNAMGTFRAIYDASQNPNDKYTMTRFGGMQFGNTGYTWYDNGRVFDSRTGRKGSYTPGANGRFDVRRINWDVTPEAMNASQRTAGTMGTMRAGMRKNGGKLMKYFQVGGQINQQQVAQEQGNSQREAMIELLQGLAAGKPQEAIANFANKLGVDEATADKYTAKILKDWSESINQAKTDPETKALIGNAIANYQSYKQKYNRPAGAPAPMAKQGTKLEYIQRLRGICPEGYELKMFKAGGKVCKKCQKVEEACKGKKMEDGGESPIVQQFKNGRKCKK